jgi:hypothetical protein
MKKGVPDPREWGRLANVAERTGFSRPELFRAAVRGDVVASHVRKPGASKGVWLVNIASVDEYIRSFLPGGSRYQKPTLGCRKEEVAA